MRGGMLPHMVLHLLSERPHSGYGLCTEIERATGHRPSYGSIYPLLDRLAQDGKISVKQDGRKKVYSLTAAGRDACRELETQRQELIQQTSSRVRALFEITGQDPGPTLSFLERLRDGDAPLGQVTGRMLRFRDTMFRMAQEGKIDRHKKEINAMLDTMQRKLEGME